MIKDIIDANNNVTVGAKEIEILKEHFPACFRNGSFDIERLKEYLKDKIHVTEEGYELRFLGKKLCPLAGIFGYNDCYCSGRRAQQSTRKQRQQKHLYQWRQPRCIETFVEVLCWQHKMYLY